MDILLISSTLNHNSLEKTLSTSSSSKRNVLDYRFFEKDLKDFLRAQCDDYDATILIDNDHLFYSNILKAYKKYYPTWNFESSYATNLKELAVNDPLRQYGSDSTHQQTHTTVSFFENVVINADNISSLSSVQQMIIDLAKGNAHNTHC
jgi:hypothetical protein